MKYPSLILVALLTSACTVETLDQYQPVVDRPGPTYAQDLTQCQALAQKAEADYQRKQSNAMLGNILVGAVTGAMVGNAVGGNSDWTTYGAASGVASGVAATDTELAHGGPRRIIDRCLASRGHTVLSDLGRG